MERINKNFWHPEECVYSHANNMMRRRTNYGLAVTCDECKRYIPDDDYSYCESCGLMWHPGCIPSSPDEINHPFHPYHPLKLVIDGPPNYSKGKCDACENEVNSFFHHCSLCDFSMHARCSKNPPPLVVDAPKCHEHILTLMPRVDTFTCNACGTHGQRCPYVCPPCGLMFHQECIKLPHVININRHDHRISHTYSLGVQDWKCLICHRKIDWRYGAYSCSTCPDYAVHSKCATRNDVWDGVELEGVPEEFIDVSPFKVIEDGVINHFSHDEHNLRLIEDAVDIDHESIWCKACTRSIFSEKHYSCLEKCDFFLHETCANLPLQKRHGLSTKPLTLVSMKTSDFEPLVGCFFCFACETVTNGFCYEYRDITLDVRCASISWYRDDECHPHTLFLTTLDKSSCGGCPQTEGYVLRCVDCDFALCFKCATLPKKLKHRCDDHFLSLRFGEKEKAKCWCEICETLLDPQKWFYTCYDCGVVCHIQCVHTWNAKPDVICTDEEHVRAVFQNNSMSRPKCPSCGSRSQLPLLSKACPKFFRQLEASIPPEIQCFSQVPLCDTIFCDPQCLTKYVAIMLEERQNNLMLEVQRRRSSFRDYDNNVEDTDWQER